MYSFRVNASCRSRQTLRVVNSSQAAPKKVLVTGASGKTGSIVVKKLLERNQDFKTTAIVSSEKSKQKLSKEVGDECEIYVNDVVNGTNGNLKEALKDCYGMVVITSAKPQIKMLSMIPVFWAKFVKKERKMPEFKFKDSPEQIDWFGAKAQFDAAKEAGVQRVVFVSSLGVTDASNTLNKIGEGNILLWKRKAEEYLIDSGLNYTILHPGGLVDQEGGKREILIGVDDEFVKRDKRMIPRADLAELCVQSLMLKQAENRAVDVITLPEGEGTITSDFANLFESMDKNCEYAKMEDPVAAQILYAS